MVALRGALAEDVSATLRPEIQAVFDRWFPTKDHLFAYSPQVVLLWRLGPP